ncbi:MAG: AI-2E family transporter [Nevskia sp.]|jgi:predicted PurR-regulated permease PerM|uniref:AI-2E family transporter n=1 Tax=Nevskia sp. TaxID=1929292 RepID=UPI0040355D37
MTPAAASEKSTALSMLREHWGWYLLVGVLLTLLYLLAPILSPFAVGAVFAYIGDPIVDRMERHRLSRTVAVCILFVLVTLVAVLALLLIVPLLQTQVLSLIDNIPNWAQWVQQVAMPKLGLKMPRGYQLDVDSLRKFLASHWDGATDFASIIAGYVGRSTPALLGFLANLFLIPIVSFYLLRDWDLMVARVRNLIPRRLLPQGIAFASEANDVLSALIRGQLLVMLALAVIYSLGLWIVGLKVALLIGILSGLVSFVPYLGFVGGLLAASVAMLVQEQSITGVAWVTLVFTVGQMLEGGVLTPMLVGDRIGLHPVAVIFAIMAGGQLFGFVGVLVALPVAAVLAVLVRHALKRWARSPLYLDPGDTAPPALESEAPP